MKLKMLIVGLPFIASIVANATTITAGGGTLGATFVTSTGVTLTAADTSFRAGTYDGTLFTQFAIADASPMDISTVASLLGKWTGNFADTSNLADPFNGKTVWFEVTTTSSGGGIAYFSGIPGATTNFPNNGGGVGDSLSYDSRNLTVLGAGSSANSAAYNAGTNTVTVGVSAIPEPSAALLGAIGALGLLRRRRN